MNSNNRVFIKEKATFRGLKRCKNCGHRSGMKSKNCKNLKCRKEFFFTNVKSSAAVNKTKVIQLVTKGDSKIYSIRVKDNKPCVRNFVKVCDKIISADENACIISRNAICYIDTCKYDSKDVNLSCKHVQYATETDALAEALSLNEDIFNRLIMDEGEKRKMWYTYLQNESSVPSIQRIDTNQFVVACDISKQFPAGLLHLNYLNHPVQGKNIKSQFECDCKKKVISISPCNTIVIENDICNHLLLLSAALLSDIKLQDEFKDFTNYISAIYLQDIMHNSTTTAANIVDNLLFFNENNISENYLNAIDNMVTTEDSAQFLVNLSADEDFQISDIEFINEELNDSSVENAISSTTPQISSAAPTTTTTSSDNINNFLNIDNNNIENLSLLSDCQIEFMDEFKLADQVDLYQATNDDFQFIETTTTTADDFITSPITTEVEMNDDNYVFSDVVDNDNNEFNMNFNFASNNNANNSLIEHIVTAEDAKIPHNDSQISSKDIKKLNITQILRLLESHGIIINKAEKSRSNFGLQQQVYESEVSSLNFVNWLDSIIERINSVMDYNDNGKPEELVFSVYHNFFRCLRARFGNGVLRRIPDVSEIITTGKFKGLTKFTWKFHKHSILKRIFSTNNMNIAIEKKFTGASDDCYRALTEDEENELKDLINNTKNSIKIKPTEYKTFLKVGPAHNNGSFQISWIPNVLPKSKHGEMRLKFEFGHKKNNKVVEK